jgi:hypothetical protein
VARIAGVLQHPRRVLGIYLARLYRKALRQIANEHEVANQLEPDTPEAAEPQPTECCLKMRQLLEVSAMPTRLDLWVSPTSASDMGVRR